MGRLFALVAVLAAAAAVVGAAIGDSPEHGAGLRFERLGADATWTAWGLPGSAETGLVGFLFQ